MQAPTFEIRFVDFPVFTLPNRYSYGLSSFFCTMASKAIIRRDKDRQ